MAWCTEIRRRLYKDIAMNLLRRQAILSHFAFSSIGNNDSSDEILILSFTRRLVTPVLPTEIKSTLSFLVHISYHRWKAGPMEPRRPLQRTRFTIVLPRWFLRRAAHMATDPCVVPYSVHYIVRLWPHFLFHSFMQHALWHTIVQFPSQQLLVALRSIRKPKFLQ